MALSDYFEDAVGIGILATSDADGNIDLAIYARPYVIGERTIAFSMLERHSFRNLQSSPKAAYMFIERGEGYKGKRLYLVKTGEETDAGKMEEIKSQHKERYSTEAAGKHLVYFEITDVRPLVGGS